AIVLNADRVRAARPPLRKDRMESFMTSNLQLGVGTVRRLLLGSMSGSVPLAVPARAQRHAHPSSAHRRLVQRTLRVLRHDDGLARVERVLRRGALRLVCEGALERERGRALDERDDALEVLVRALEPLVAARQIALLLELVAAELHLALDVLGLL